MRALFSLVCAALTLAAAPADAQVRLAGPAGPLAPSAAVAPSAAAAAPALAAALLPGLSPALLVPVPIAVPVPVPIPVAAAPAAGTEMLDALLERGWVRSGAWVLVLREGLNDHGKRVLAIDALDAGAPLNAGAAGHVDIKIQDPGYPAVLDGSLDWYLRSDPARLPPGADPARWRKRLGLGISVESAVQGRGLGAHLLELAAALAAREGAERMVILATDSSRGFYRARFRGRIVSEESFTGADESEYHRFIVSL